MGRNFPIFLPGLKMMIEMKFGKLLLSTVALALAVPALFGQTAEKVRLKNYDMAVPFASTEGLRLAEGELPIKEYDLVLKDIKGKEYNLKELLQSGKKVFIDFSAVWCGPCWMLHQYGTLSELHKMYGDSETGNKEMVVLWVEAEGAEKAVISQKGVGGNTQGDWTEEGKWPVPIVSDKFLAKRLGIILKAVPSCYVLLPGGSYVEIPQEEYLLGYDRNKSIAENAKSGKSKQAAEAIYNRVKNMGLKKGDKPVVASVDIPSIVEGRTVQFKAPKALSMHGFVRFNWTFEGGTPEKFEQSSVTELPSVVWNAPGKRKITITPIDQSGSGAPYVVEVDVIAKTFIDKFPYEYGFESDAIDPQWAIVDQDGDGHSWTTLQAHFKWVKFWNPEFAKSIAFRGENSAVSWKVFPIDIDPEEGQIQGAECLGDNSLISPGIKIPADAVKPTAYFFACDYLGIPEPDKGKGEKVQERQAFSVKLSTQGQAKETFTTVLVNKGMIQGHYTPISIDLSAYKGQTVYLEIHHEANYPEALALQVDCFGVVLDGNVPNYLSTDRVAPVLPLECLVGEGQLSLSAQGLQEAALINAAGVQVAHAKGADQLTMDTVHLPAGTYVVIATGADKSLALRKVIIP